MFDVGFEELYQIRYHCYHVVDAVNDKRWNTWLNYNKFAASNFSIAQVNPVSPLHYDSGGKWKRFSPTFQSDSHQSLDFTKNKLLRSYGPRQLFSLRERFQGDPITLCPRNSPWLEPGLASQKADHPTNAHPISIRLPAVTIHSVNKDTPGSGSAWKYRGKTFPRRASLLKFIFQETNIKK